MYLYVWSNGAAPTPPEYVDLILCRDVYHCTPSELDEQDAARVETHLICLSAENEARADHDDNSE